MHHPGYDYSVDLWAFGILVFEMYEDHGPFGPDDVEETQLFTAVTSHKSVFCYAETRQGFFVIFLSLGFNLLDLTSWFLCCLLAGHGHAPSICPSFQSFGSLL
jgi:serine/threonine protein kinase